MIKWTTRKSRSHISDADISIYSTRRFVRFIFRNQCKRLIGNDRKGDDRLATYKRFSGDYTVKVADETGLFYIEKGED